jgi:hypothetical protein
MQRAERKDIELCKPIARPVLDKFLRPALRRFRLEIVKTDTLMDIGSKAQELLVRKAEIAKLKQEQAADRRCVADELS